MNSIRAFWFSSNNFGDNLNHYLISRLSGLPAVYSDDRKKPHYMVCGSILAHAKKKSIVWGPGFGSHEEAREVPGEILMVRGKKSASYFDKGFTVLGDPALLMPELFPYTWSKHYKKSIAPHWKDYEMCLRKYGNKYKIIDPFQPAISYIIEIVSSEQVLCSGLHPLIIADAYGVPNKRIDFGTDIGGDGFKFEDYYSTTGSGVEAAQPITGISWEECAVNPYAYSLDDLYNSCPFKNQNTY